MAFEGIAKDLPGARALVYEALDKLADLDPRAAAMALAEAAAKLVAEHDGTEADFRNLAIAAWKKRERTA